MPFAPVLHQSHDLGFYCRSLLWPESCERSPHFTGLFRGFNLLGRLTFPEQVAEPVRIEANAPSVWHP